MLRHAAAYALFCILIHGVSSQTEEGDSCLEPFTNSVGRCTLVEKCQTAIEDFQKKGIRPTNCKYTANSVLVCCRDKNNVSENKPAAPATTLASRPDNRVGSNKKVGIKSRRKCREYSNSVTETVAFVPLLTDPESFSLSGSKCDYTGTELIIGGEDAKRGEFPHMAAIGWKNSDDDDYSFGCGGSLISSRFVLTAGHCTYAPDFPDPLPSIVRLGDQNLNPRVRDGANPIDVPIINITKHPNYKPPQRYNDIALLRLASDVKFGDYIRPACLWTEPNFGNNKKVLATGWGVTNPDTANQKADVLQKVSLSILDNLNCNNLLSNIINRNWDHGFEDTQMCAGELRQGKDTCQGDSGSPLQIVSEDNQCIFNVVGITSFGAKYCGNQPAVYTRVSSFLGWIESVVWPDE